MQGHFGLQPPDLPARAPQPQAKLWLLARDQSLTIAADLLQGDAPHQSIAATGLGLANRGVPFLVAEAVEKLASG